MKTTTNSAQHKLLHDIRGGLSPILIYTQLIAYNLEKVPSSAETIRELTKEIENSVKSLERLLDTENSSV